MKLKRMASVCMAIGIMFSLVACQSEKSEPTDLSKLTVGQVDVNFGEYTWTVLEVKDDAALLITNEIVENATYHDEDKSIDWVGSHLRWYLNWKFIYEHFTEDEQEKIVEVMNTTPDNVWGTSGGGNSLDKIFLLSIEETVKYFGDSSQLKDKDSESDYIINDGYNEKRIAKFDGVNASWWLRSPGHTSKFVAEVTPSGTIEENSVMGEIGIRPVIWVKMK